MYQDSFTCGIFAGHASSIHISHSGNVLDNSHKEFIMRRPQHIFFTVLLSLMVLTFSLVVSCRHAANEQVSVPEEESAGIDYDGNSSNCNQDKACTKEYQPHVCVQQGVRGEGDNFCLAEKALTFELCKQNKIIDQNIAVCVLAVCEEKMCTSIYEPATCRYDGLVFKGDNGCDAFNKVRKRACAQKKILNEAEVICTKDRPDQSDDPSQSKGDRR